MEISGQLRMYHYFPDVREDEEYYEGIDDGLIMFLPLNHTISPLITTNHPLIFYNNASFTK